MLQQLANASLAGLLSGLALALLDTRQAANFVHSPMEIGLLLLQSTARLSLTGAVLGCFAAFVTQICTALGNRTGRSLALRPETVFTLLASPGLIYITVRLFQGGATSRLPARSILITLTAVVLLALFWSGARMILALINRTDNRDIKGAALAVISVGLALVVLALRWADAHMYKRLYLYLHSALGLATLGGLALVFRITLLRRGKPPNHLRFSTSALAAVTLLFVCALLTSDMRQSVRIASWEHTATLANLLRTTTYTREKSPNVGPDAKTLRLREERAKRARQAALSAWPTFPDAHILLITIDALRADRLGIYGNTNRQLSPNMDNWARNNATVFERSYCPAPHSSYSITSIMTSRHTHDEAMLGKEITHVTLPEVLNKNAYETEGFYTQGIFFTEGEKVGHYRRNRFGFKKLSHGAPPPEELTDKAIAAIDRIVAREEAPSFLWVHYFNVHEPYRANGLGNSPQDRYDSEIQLADKAVSRLIAYAEMAFSGEVIIAISADHGEEFKDHGGYYHGSALYDEQVRIPLIIRVPGNRPGRVRAPVSNVGLAPTLLKLVGIEPPGTMIGQDLRPAVFGGDSSHVAEPVFCAVMSQHMVVKWPHKLIADPSRKLYELYNLETDPKEQLNLYDGNQGKANELLQEIHAWRDKIATCENEDQTFLNLGHMRDVRAVSGLMQVAGNENASTSNRVEAVELLGNIRDYSAVPLLRSLLDDREIQVATTAAFVLGDLGNVSGRDLMHDALFHDDPAIRDRAGLALGRLGDSTAAPALVEALGRNNLQIREKAIRMLGRLADPSTTEPLLTALSELRNRYLVILALGKIGDPKAYDPLMKILDSDNRTDVRGYAVLSLGWLELPGAIPRLIRVLKEEPEIKWTPESLVRLGAVGPAPVFGTDVAKDLPTLKSGFGKCTEKRRIIHHEYMDRTSCQTTGRVAEITFFADIPDEAVALLRARHLLDDKSQTASLAMAVDGKPIGQVELTPEFQEFRIATEPGIWSAREHRVTFKLGKTAPFELDHFLVIEK
ncbi:MAG: sulfatase-like hydrolase/transferase [Proteobacteria bacterium]|nr:sulfatase-like hydrolase/transferase [Pseudomonadota bacterium]